MIEISIQITQEDFDFITSIARSNNTTIEEMITSHAIASIKINNQYDIKNSLTKKINTLTTEQQINVLKSIDVIKDVK